MVDSTHQDREEPRVSPKEDPEQRQAIDLSGRISIWVPVAFACTGFLIGFVTGLSSSPVVKQLLPLVFGVIAGGGGFFARVRTDQSRTIGVSITLLALLASIGIVQGIVIRDNSSWRDFWLGKPAPDALRIGDSDRQDLKRYVAVLKLRDALQRTGLDPVERQRILDLASHTNDLTPIEDAASQFSNINRQQIFLNEVPALANQAPTPSQRDTVLRTTNMTGN
jgi:hypothetical protein